MKIVTAWSGTGEFTAKHVQALARQCEQYAPLTDFVCITPEKIDGVECWKPTHKWIGWWHKYEIFAPHIRGPMLYMDIDTVIRHSLSDVLAIDKLTLLRDAYRDGKRLKEGLQASLMLLPEEDRASIWKDWALNPQLHMLRLGVKGDQPMLEKHFLDRAQRWQDILPGQTASWKVNCGGGNAFAQPVIPADTRVIFFHGKPRPWDVPQFKGLYA